MNPSHGTSAGSSVDKGPQIKVTGQRESSGARSEQAMG